MNFRLHIVALCGAGLLIPAAGLAADKDPAPKAAAKQATKEKPAPAKCERTTGSRIKPGKDRDCSPSTSATRSYTAEELQNTGKTDIADALRNLDPSIR